MILFMMGIQFSDARPTTGVVNFANDIHETSEELEHISVPRVYNQHKNAPVAGS